MYRGPCDSLTHTHTHTCTHTHSVWRTFVRQRSGVWVSSQGGARHMGFVGRGWGGASVTRFKGPSLRGSAEAVTDPFSSSVHGRSRSWPPTKERFMSRTKRKGVPHWDQRILRSVCGHTHTHTFSLSHTHRHTQDQRISKNVHGHMFTFSYTPNDARDHSMGTQKTPHTHMWALTPRSEDLWQRAITHTHVHTHTGTFSLFHLAILDSTQTRLARSEDIYQFEHCHREPITCIAHSQRHTQMCFLTCMFAQTLSCWHYWIKQWRETEGERGRERERERERERDNERERERDIFQ